MMSRYSISTRRRREFKFSLSGLEIVDALAKVDDSGDTFNDINLIYL